MNCRTVLLQITNTFCTTQYHAENNIRCIWLWIQPVRSFQEADGFGERPPGIGAASCEVAHTEPRLTRWHPKHQPVGAFRYGNGTGSQPEVLQLHAQD